MTPRAQLPEEPPFFAQPGKRTAEPPAAIDDEKAAQRGMAGEHAVCFGVHQRIDLEVGMLPLQCREHRRGEQDIAVKSQLYDQDPLDAGKIDGVGWLKPRAKGRGHG